MGFDQYVRYILTESAGVERSWCAATLAEVFPGATVHDVVFEAYLAEIETL